MLFDLQKPYIMFHGNSKVFGKSNSSILIKKALKYKIDIIELDIIKSKDGIIYCHHGGFFSFSLKFLNFKTIQEIFKIESLEDILSVILIKKIIFLDIKDKSISSRDLEKVISKFSQEFWLAGYNLEYLYSLKNNLGDNFSYVYNFSFFNLRRGFRKAKKYEIDAFKIFWWQCNDKNIKKLKDSNIVYTIHPWFMSKKKYKKLLNKYGSLWVAVDDPSKPEELLMKI